MSQLEVLEAPAVQSYHQEFNYDTVRVIANFDLEKLKPNSSALSVDQIAHLFNPVDDKKILINPEPHSPTNLELGIGRLSDYADAQRAGGDKGPAIDQIVQQAYVDSFVHGFNLANNALYHTSERQDVYEYKLQGYLSTMNQVTRDVSGGGYPFTPPTRSSKGKECNADDRASYFTTVTNDIAHAGVQRGIIFANNNVLA